MKRPLPDRNKAESGQSIIIIAFVIILLFGIVGLAIDGGGLLLLKRDEQNAVDAAVLAAAYARCTNGDWKKAGETAAADNGFVTGQEDTTVNVISPPTTGPKAGDTNFVEVSITRIKPKYFIQIVYRGDLTVTARAVGYCNPGAAGFQGGGIVGMSDHCSNTVDLSGSDSIVEGPARSNNDLKSTGSTHVINGECSAVTTIDGAVVCNPIAPGAPKMSKPSFYNLVDFQSGGKFAQAATTDGNYTSLPGPATLPDDLVALGKPFQGLIYVNGDVNIKGLTGLNTDVGITVVASGEIKVGTVASNSIVPAYLSNKLLFFTPEGDPTKCGTSGGISVSGSNNRFFGLIYAPNGPISFSGSNNRIEGAIVGNTVDGSASKSIIIYDPSVIPPMPPDLVVAE